MIARPVWLSWEGDNTRQVVSPNLTYTCGTKTLTAANFKGHLAGNADSATNASLISPFEIATANVFRNVWFSDSDTSNKACYNPNIQYNPASNVLKVGTVQGNLAGNAATATNADKLDGYHASDLLRTLGGNRTPVMTDIFDRAGTIDLTAMNATAKANNKAKINKSRNSLQNIWNTSTGIVAYGGDIDMSGGYHHGTLKLTQSYKNFDKILVVGTNDDANIVFYKLWNVYELIFAFSHSFRFPLYNEDTYWTVYGSVRTGTATNYSLSTDTIWSCYDQGAGIIAIYGIKY